MAPKPRITLTVGFALAIAPTAPRNSEARRDALVVIEKDLLEQAADALNCATLAKSDLAKRLNLDAARICADDAAGMRTEITRIEACWS